MAQFSLSEIDQRMEMMNPFPELNPIPSMNFHNMLGFSSENFLLPQYPANLGQQFPENYNHGDNNNQSQLYSDSVCMVSEGNHTEDSKKRKSVDLRESGLQVSEDGVARKNSWRKGKRSKVNVEGDEKLKEVVHVRAKRGQATDSHSLAERVRRGKINEKIKCLQGIVPGCYKSMGMAVMLDEIINYVQSLQNQVEFLSMKLTAASRYHDFNLDTDAMEAMMKAKAYEEQKTQRNMGEGYRLISSTQMGSYDFTFGTCPSLPYNT